MRNLSSIRLIIGLGNPEKKYENTYHNAGFLFVEYLAENFPDLETEIEILKSEEYMNLSGKFVARILRKHNLKPENLLIAHDDSDLKLGEYKLQFGRGAAGHHGAESVQTALKTKNFWRLRIGIRKADLPADLSAKALASAEAPRAKAGKFVLKKISAADKKTLEGVFEEAAKRLNQPQH